MRKSMITGAAVAASLALAGAAQADTNVRSLAGDWSASNSTVAKTADGIHFGTYADGGNVGGSVLYKGKNGLKLSDVKKFSFTFNYKQAGNLSGAAPYARIWLDTDHDGQWTNGADEDIIFDPSLGGAVTPVQGADLTFGTADDSVRYNDDSGSSAQKRWGDVVKAHGTEAIAMIGVSQGYSMGADVSAMLKNVVINGEKFTFDTPPADGHDGEKGEKGDAGANGTTTVIHDRGRVSGATLRTLHIRKIAGMKFVGARASLRGKRLHARGRTIKVDLRGKSAGRYRVSITAKYKANGRVYKVRSVRNLNITRK